MAGGTWQSQNKVRAGAYINFESVPKSQTKVGTRGIGTIPIPLSWGDSLVELYSEDLVDGSSLAKVGLEVTDESALILRKHLSHCYKSYIYRLDVGGTKATATVGSKKYEAKYTGSFGNKIEIVVTQNLYAYVGSTIGTFYTSEQLALGTIIYTDETLDSPKGVVTEYTNAGTISVKIDNGSAETVTEGTASSIMYTVQTLVNGVRKDSQTVATGTELVDNDFVVFDDVPTLTATAGTPLVGGTDGTVSDSAYISYFAEMGEYKFDTMGLPYASARTVLDAAKLFITQQNENYGKKCKLVVKNYSADSDYIINVVTGYETVSEIITPEIAVAEVAGMDAGAAINESLTYKVVAEPEDAVRIINPIPNKDIEKALNAGKFFFTKRSDGAIVVEKDINSFRSFTPKKSYVFSKNRPKRTMDEIANTCNLIWETSYIGKVDNNASGRNIYKGDIVQYLYTLQDTYNAIQNFNSETDIEVLAGNDIDAALVNLAIQPVDSMEKLYMSVKVKG